MVKKAKQRKSSKPLMGPKARKLLLPVFVLLGIGVIVLTVFSIILMPKENPGSQYGVGADGFSAYVEKEGDLGVGSVVDKSQVVTALGDKAKSVDNAQISQVFNLNGNRSQTLTYPFTRTDGVKANLFIDMRLYKNLKALEDDHIYVATAKAGTVGGYPAHYKLAQTIDGDREYHMIVVNGLRAYRFVVAQPAKSITINEVPALAVLKRLALEAKL